MMFPLNSVGGVKIGEGGGGSISASGFGPGVPFPPGHRWKSKNGYKSQFD